MSNNNNNTHTQLQISAVLECLKDFLVVHRAAVIPDEIWKKYPGIPPMLLKSGSCIIN